MSGRVMPMTMHGEPVRSFLPGWRATLLYTGFAPLLLLELRHEDGREATWFLDYRMQRIADRVDQLGPELTDLLLQQAVPVLRRLLDMALQQCVPVLDPLAAAFLQLGEATRRAIGLACRERLLPRPGRCLVEHLVDGALLFRNPADGTLHAIGRHHLEDGLRLDWQDRIAASLASGSLLWPSPVDGTMLQAEGCLCFDDFHFAYRFADPRHGLVFFVIAADHRARVAGVWFPGSGLLVTGRHELSTGLAQFQVLPHLAHWVVGHVCVWGADLARAFRGEVRGFASVLRGGGGVHIGHQLWNELTGIDHLLRTHPELTARQALPDWIVLDAASAIELYGPLETMFPALEGRVNRTLPDTRALIRFCYETGTLPVRITSEHVSASLRSRILGSVAAAGYTRAAREALDAAMPEVRRPVVLLGLRVENRTLTDLSGFLRRLATRIAARFPGAALVVDGHNSRSPGPGLGGAVIGSHGEDRASRPPIEVEHEMAAGLRAACDGLPVHVFDTIGQPVGASLGWAMQCDCFVSVWGASLAKYRWVCNKPGYVLTSRFNLSHRADLHIYDSPDTMEQPAPLYFVDPVMVTDRPEAPVLLDVAPGEASFRNFDIDEAAVLERILRLIDAECRR